MAALDASIKPPKWIGEEQEKQSNRDRVFFEEHPRRTSYRRAYNPYEFWPMLHNPVADIKVEVINIREGIRTRRIVGHPGVAIVPNEPQWLGDNDWAAVVARLRSVPPIPLSHGEFVDKMRQVAAAMPPPSTPA